MYELKQEMYTHCDTLDSKIHPKESNIHLHAL